VSSRRHVTFGGDEGWREASVMEKDVCSRPREEGGDGDVDVGGSATFQEKRGGGEASIPGGRRGGGGGGC
jgi:hypothetical protein